MNNGVKQEKYMNNRLKLDIKLFIPVFLKNKM